MMCKKKKIGREGEREREREGEHYYTVVTKSRGSFGAFWFCKADEQRNDDKQIM